MVLERGRGKIPEGSVRHGLSTCDLMERQYEQALSRLESVAIPAFGNSADYYIRKAVVLDLLGDSSRADRHYDSARVFLESLPVSTALRFRRDVRLAVACAGLGRREEALTLSRNAVMNSPVEKDAFAGTGTLRSQALVNVMLGNHETAIDQLEYLLSVPSFTSVAELKLDPRLDPLRENPRFQELLARGHTVF
jgi:tetratricopeptide (TPR) repeat protein